MEHEIDLAIVTCLRPEGLGEDPPERVVVAVRQGAIVAVAILMTVLTLGRMRLNWTGGPSAAEGVEDPGQPSVTRLQQPPAAPPRDT